MDIGIFQQGDGNFDLQIKDGDLQSDEGLETAVLISLFSDMRVTDEELPQGEANKRGFWADQFSGIGDDKIGSRFWLLHRQKRTNETLRLSEDYAKESLQWMIDDGVADAITAAAQYEGEVSDGFWATYISIFKPSGVTRFKALWDKQELVRG